MDTDHVPKAHAFPDEIGQTGSTNSTIALYQTHSGLGNTDITH